MCACLGLSAIRNKDKVGLIAFSRQVDLYVRPEKGIGHALRIVRDCLALPGASSETRIQPALELAARVVRRGAILFLVSDFLGGGWQRAISIWAAPTRSTPAAT